LGTNEPPADRSDGAGSRRAFPSKTPVVGTDISMTSYDEVIDTLDGRPTDRATVVAVCTVHSVMSARRDPQLAEAIGSADIATSDGVPLVWAIRWTARPNQQRVYGPELMRRSIANTVDRGWRHYFYGSTPETLAELEAAVAVSDPDAVVAGSYSPPFRPLTTEETDAIIDDILSKDTDVVWVGLGMPKQELWMHEVRDALPGVALVGVGAAFDFIAGTKKEAPPWIQRAGLEWLFRLSQEPRRLWRRYVYNNPGFVVLLAAQVAEARLRRRKP
jgi:N-acetylglucosaminyldiphosphoundecaprenol N-acetyl-beta-D-mannosaminyltransferase